MSLYLQKKPLSRPMKLLLNQRALLLWYSHCHLVLTSIYVSFTEIQTNPIQCLIIEQFEDTFNQPDPQECLRKLVDPRIGDDYPIESIRKVMNRLINQDLFLV